MYIIVSREASNEKIKGTKGQREIIVVCARVFLDVRSYAQGRCARWCVCVNRGFLLLWGLRPLKGRDAAWVRHKVCAAHAGNAICVQNSACNARVCKGMCVQRNACATHRGCNSASEQKISTKRNGRHQGTQAPLCAAHFGRTNHYTL
jgi:hypothetical protein